jgi:hypothetical protein
MPQPAANSNILSHGTSWVITPTTGGGGCCEGSWGMIHQPILRVYYDNHHRTTAVLVDFRRVNNNTCCEQSNYGIRIAGTETSADGYWAFTQDPNDGRIHYLWGSDPPGTQRTTGINQSPTGRAVGVPLVGTYRGGGTFNPVPKGFNISVKSFRIWSCRNWRTTQCSKYNDNNPYQ